MQELEGIASFCVTPNHWSDDVTSRAYVQDLYISYIKEQCNELGLEYGEQHVVLILDVWYGWIDPGFTAWLRESYPFVRLIYVPPACTPIGQPMDAGIIPSVKGLMRKKYGQWCLAYVSGWLKGGGLAEEVNSASVV